MNCKYDATADAAYITLDAVIPDGGVARTFTVPGADDVMLDYDALGQLVGVELLAPKQRLHRLAPIAAEYGFAQYLDTLYAALATALSFRGGDTFRLTSSSATYPSGAA